MDTRTKVMTLISIRTKGICHTSQLLIEIMKSSKQEKKSELETKLKAITQNRYK